MFKTLDALNPEEFEDDYQPEDQPLDQTFWEEKKWMMEEDAFQAYLIVYREKREDESMSLEEVLRTSSTAQSRKRKAVVKGKTQPPKRAKLPEKGKWLEKHAAAEEAGYGTTS